MTGWIILLQGSLNELHMPDAWRAVGESSLEMVSFSVCARRKEIPKCKQLRSFLMDIFQLLGFAAPAMSL